MKFKLNKNHYSKIFNFLKQFDKQKITIKENKLNKTESLFFINKDSKFYIYSSNNTVSCYADLNVSVADFTSFAVDINLFCSAFHNFPTDEINFFIDLEDKNLIFGNKKTKVSLNISLLDKVDDFEKMFSDSEEYIELDNNKFNNSIKLTINSCSNELEDFPYNHLMFFVKNNSFSFYGSDKHRISISGDKYENNNFYLISKNSAELLLLFTKENENFRYKISNDKLYIESKEIKFCTILNRNANQNIYIKMNEFINDSNILINTKIDRIDFIKSLKFVNSITNNEILYFNFYDNILAISNSKNDKNLVADKIMLSQQVENLDSSYLATHIIKLADTIIDPDLNLIVMNYNNYNLLMLESKDVVHIIFPMV